MQVSILETETVHIDSYDPHPKNARRGNHEVIKASLERFGQYKPVIVNRRTGHIVAGNNVWAVMRNQGWTEYEASIIDVDDETELEILIVDNRSSDLAEYEDSILIANLSEIDSEGLIGWESLDKVEQEIAEAQEADLTESSAGEDLDLPEPTIEPPGNIDAATPPPEPPGVSSGLGQPVISYTIIFDDEDQKLLWTSFLRWLRSEYDSVETTGARVAQYVLDLDLEEDEE